MKIGQFIQNSMELTYLNSSNYFSHVERLKRIEGFVKKEMLSNEKLNLLNIIDLFLSKNHN